MFAKAKAEIVQEKIDLLLKVGLGQFGKVSNNKICIIKSQHLFLLIISCEF
jgi:hypothetical protein